MTSKDKFLTFVTAVVTMFFVIFGFIIPVAGKITGMQVKSSTGYTEYINNK